MGSTNFLHKKLVLQKKSNMIFITLFALANVCLAFDLTLEPEGKDRALCCVDAKRQCGDKCSGKLCSESCEARCGLFNTNCGSCCLYFCWATLPLHHCRSCGHLLLWLHCLYRWLRCCGQWRIFVCLNLFKSIFYF